jgi:hypothetical protein
LEKAEHFKIAGFSSWAAFDRDRAPQVLADAGPLAAFDNMEMYSLLTGSAFSAPVAVAVPVVPAP